MRCCLADEDFRENPDACIKQDDEEKTYTFAADTCTETTCVRTNSYLPYDADSGRDLVFYKLGETCTPQGSPTTVDNDFCCEYDQQGCASEIESREYTEGSCNNDDCTMCSLKFYTATSYFNNAGELVDTIVDNEGGVMTDASVSDLDMCCVAGIQLDDFDLL